jgi:hypothetical protein
MQEVTLSAESVRAVAQQLFELMQTRPAVSDPWMTREQAADYLNLPLRTFTKLRSKHPEALKPCETAPLRFSRTTLDAFKVSRGATLRRPGRRPGASGPRMLLQEQQLSASDSAHRS